MPRLSKNALAGVLFAALLCAAAAAPAREMDSYPVVKLQSLDKVTARTMTFEAKVGSTVKFGPLYIKVQSCQKAPPVETPEAAAFLQIWQVNAKNVAEWVFSGWMFASSPGLSYMDHPIYDVWVLDCLEHKSGEAPPPEQQPREGEGEVPESSVPAQPAGAAPATTAPAPSADQPATDKPSEETAPADDGDLDMQQ